MSEQLITKGVDDLCLSSRIGNYIQQRRLLLRAWGEAKWARRRVLPCVAQAARPAGASEATLSYRILRRMDESRLWLTMPVTLLVLFLAAWLGRRPSLPFLTLLVALAGSVLLLQQLQWGLWVLVVAALVLPVEFGTGTEVSLNLATLLVPALAGLWLFRMINRRELHLAPSRTTMPLALFLLASLLSFLIGNMLWDPAVPRSAHFAVVQLAQLAILVFSACAFWLAGNLVRDETELQRLTFLFLVVAGGLALLVVLSGDVYLLVMRGVATLAVVRAPFWLLFTALAGGQLLFNRELPAGWRLFLIVALSAVAIYVFYQQRATLSYWMGVAVAAGALAWLRWPRLRWVFVGLAVVGLTVAFPAIYQFAGGDAEWEESGGSRLALIERVVEESMRNPITGLGPAAYRPYTAMRPLLYRRAYWVEPKVNSHNNYVDLFSQFGLVGLGLFAWFAVEVIQLGVRLRACFTQGFAAGYVNAMLAAWIGSLVAMLLADWILPFIYNIGFPGFQASVLVWMFLGGLISLEAMNRREMPADALRLGEVGYGT